MYKITVIILALAKEYIYIYKKNICHKIFWQRIYFPQSVGHLCTFLLVSFLFETFIEIITESHVIIRNDIEKDYELFTQFLQK